MRAVGVRAQNDDKSFALIRPGDRVDVIATLPDTAGDKRSSVVLLQNILVLAVGLDTGAESVGGARSPSDQRDLILSLSLSVPEAQLISLAKEKGILTVALRNPDDVRVTDGLADLNSSTLTDSKTRKVVQDFRKGSSAAPPVNTGPTRLPSSLVPGQ